MKYYYLKRHKGIFFYLQHGHKRYGYYLTYYDAQHKRHKKSRRGFSNLSSAVNGLMKAHQRYEALKGSKKMTFGQWCHVFLVRKKAEVSKITTYINYEHLLKRDVIPYIGKTMLVDLRPMSYKFQCLMQLFNQKHFSRKSVMAVNGRVQTVMNSAVKNGLLNRNPLKWVTIPKVNERPKKVILTHRQLAHFNNILKKHSIQVQTIFLMLEDTGMRCGEMLGLKWSDIDMQKRLIHIQRTRDGYGVRKPKTEMSNRIIMMTKRLTDTLGRYYMYCRHHFHINHNSFIILGRHGKPLTHTQPDTMLKRLLIECNLKKYLGRFTCHSFRHQIISTLIGNGVSVIKVSHFVGHANVSTTLDIYAQNAPGEHLNIDKGLLKSK